MKVKGKVKFFNQQRAFGFIEAGGEDHFVHIVNVDGDTLLEGEEVEFVAVEARKGLQALEVVRLNPPQMIEEQGTVKSFSEEQGYGFISRPGSRADAFMHISDLVDKEAAPPEPGDHVRFTVREGRNGRDRAYNIEFVSRAR